MADKPVETAADERTPGAGLIGTAIKAVAVTLSVVMLILAILTVAMPLSAMRVFNNLGMSERALSSGETFIARHVRGADEEDDLGNFAELAKHSELTTDEFVEALDTCVGLADKLMRASAASGDDASAVYFAEKLERYTRMYASLGDVAAVNAAKNAANLAAVPFVSMRPYVYSYAHTNLELNYRARAYLGETNRMLYVSNTDGDCVITIDNRANTFGGLDIAGIADTELKASTLMSFADYCAELEEYIAVCFERVGVKSGLGESDFTRGEYAGKQQLSTGNEFSLFVTPEHGFSNVYNQLKNVFSIYMQEAIDLPATTADAMLRRLYIVGELSTFARRMWDMAILFNYNRDVFGLSRAAVVEEYVAKTCENYFWTEYKGIKRVVSEVYDEYKTNYVAFVATGNNNTIN